MYTDRPLQAAFLASLLTHAFLLGIFSLDFFHFTKSHDSNMIKVSYVKTAPGEQKLKTNAALSKQKLVRNEPLPKPSRSSAEKIRNMEFGNVKIKAEDLKRREIAEIKAFKIANAKPVLFGMGRAQEFVDLDNLANIKTKSLFLDYYREIREKIRKYAILNYPANFVEGEVYLTFTIDSAGSLKELSIVDFKSTEEFSLREAGLRSVKEASPFPSFPEGLTKKNLTFHIIISFELSR